jgi:hypothetical protein
MLGPPEIVVAEDVLGFAGIAPPTLRIYPIETHIAEKLHAFTMPRARPNSRVKDLPDLALLASAGPLEAERLRAALEQTFTFRKTHALPPALPAPPPCCSPIHPGVSRSQVRQLGNHGGLHAAAGSPAGRGTSMAGDRSVHGEPAFAGLPPRDDEFVGQAVRGAEVHFVGRLAGERRMRHLRVVLLDEEGDERSR